MNFNTHNTATIQTTGSGLLGHIDASYDELVDLFGKPSEGDGYKVDAHWAIEFEGGTIASIYNYKDGKNYLSDEGKTVEQIRDWHVGGFNPTALTYVQIAIDLARESKDDASKAKKPDEIRDGITSMEEMMDVIRSTKGEIYASTIEVAHLSRKRSQLVNMLLARLVQADAMDEDEAEMLNDVDNMICARTIGSVSKHSGIKPSKEAAEELMGWVDKFMAIEEQLAKKVMAMQGRDD